MSNEITDTNSASLATLISSRTQYYYDKTAVADKLVTGIYKIEVPKGTRSVTMDQNDTLTFAAVTQGAHKDSEEFDTLTNAHTVTPITYGTNIIESWELSQSTPIDLMEAYAQAGAAAYVIALESADTISYAANHVNIEESSPNHEIGANGIAMTAGLIRQGVYLLMAQGARQPYNLVIDPIQFNELMQDAEFRTYAVANPAAIHGYAATVGVSMERYLGQIYGCHVWVGNGQAEDNGLWAIMSADGAWARGYKNWFTPSLPTPAELHVSKEWDDDLSAYRIWFRCCFDIKAWSGDSTASNNFAVGIAS